MMDEEAFYQAGSKFLREILDDDDLQLDADTELLESGLLDSLSILEFFFFIEEFRGAAISSDEANPESISSLRNAYKLASTK